MGSIKTYEEKVKNDERFRRHAEWSNMPIVTYKTHRLFNFLTIAGAEEAYQAALAFVAGKSPHHFITFTGEPGRGKTHLALGIGWHWIENGRGLIKYCQVEALLDQLRGGIQTQATESHFRFDTLFNAIKNLPLLILDDLGVEQSTPWARAKLDEMLDYRYIQQLPTVFTTNLHPNQLEPRVASRLKEGVVVLLKCGDYREVIAKSRKRK